MESAIWDFMKPKIDAYVEEKMVEKDKIKAAQGKEIIQLKKIIGKIEETVKQSLKIRFSMIIACFNLKKCSKKGLAVIVFELRISAASGE